MTRFCSLLGALGFVVVFGAMPGCNCNHSGNNMHLGGSHDMAMAGGDGGGGPGGDGGGMNACNDDNVSCMNPCLGPTCMPPTMFPLPGDTPADPNVGADGVGRQPGTGWVVLNSGNAVFNYLWIADDQNYFAGMVSKIDTRNSGKPGAPTNVNGPYREVARYLTVTCQSNEPASWKSHDAFVIGQNAANGGPGPTVIAGDCDGTNGCCARAAAGARTPVQMYHNRPSRTAVDYNGDAWIANRAHDSYGGADPWDSVIRHQSSVTKIANDVGSCIDRNGNGKIDTSSDVNDDGIIQTDCNANGIPDSIADVAAHPCVGGAVQEFYGLDDECILFTTNTGAEGGTGRPLTLGPGAIDTGVSDAWAGRYSDGVFYRIDGSTGLVKATVQVNDVNTVHSRPYGAAIDQTGVLWAPNVDNQMLFYFDTKNTANQGGVAPPQVAAAGSTGATTWKGAFYGIAVDANTVTPAGGMPMLSQQIWVASVFNSDANNFTTPGVWRYAPNRALGFAGLNQGTWTLFTFTATGAITPSGNGRGVGVDNRQPQSYAWTAIDGSSGIGRVPVNANPNTDPTKTLTIAVPAVAGQTYLSTTGSGTLGAGVAADLDIWGINQNSSTATHFKVDATGTQVGIDQIDLNDDGHLPGAAPVHHQPPVPYTYSDFTGFGLRNFTNPRGFYSYKIEGCGAGKTKWLRVEYDADVPANTTLSVKARSADSSADLDTATYTMPYSMSPADLQAAPGPVMPNPSGWLQVEFDLATKSNGITPALKSFHVVYECVGGIS
jgi:hypothetical protein